MKWIDIKKIKPKLLTRVIFYYPFYLNVKDFMAVDVYVTGMEEKMGFTHWAYLPKPPKD